MDFTSAGPEETKKPSGARNPPPDSNPFNDAEFDRNLARLSRPAYRERQSPLQVPNTVSFLSERISLPSLYDQAHLELVNRPFQFRERRQLSVAMRVNNPNRSPFMIES